MIITGNNSYTYEIYPQSGMSAVFKTDRMKDFSLRILTNSGGSYYQDFIFESGRGFIGNSQTTGGYNYVVGYKQAAPFEFEFRYDTGRYSFYNNGEIKLANKQILNSQTVQSYSIKPTITGFVFSGIGSDNMTGSFEVYGRQPGVYFSPITQYLSNSGLYSGYIIISGDAAKLNYITPLNGYQYSIPSSSFTSGNYIITGLNFGSGATVNTDFNFNFGTVNTDLVFYIPNTGVAGGYLNLSASSEGTILSGLPNPTQYKDYIATNLVGTTANFQPYLEFLYRSGDMLISGTGTMTGTLTGYISGSGYLYGTGTGTTYQGFYNQRGVTYALPNFHSGYTESMIQFVYGTGQIVYNYNILATGIEWVFSPGLNDNTTGRLTGTLTGTILDGSGYYHFYQTITGRPQFWSGAYQTGNQAIGEYYNNGAPSSPDSRYDNNYESQNYTGNINLIVYWTGNVSKTVTQPFTGTYQSGVYSTASGYITGFNLLTGNPSLLTGTPEFVYSNYYNYTGNGNVSTRFLIKSAIPRTAGIYEYGIRMTYDRNVPEGVSDYYRFVVSDGTNTVTTTGQGYYL